MRLLDEGRRTLDRELTTELERLPSVEARALHRLADRLAAGDEGNGIAMLLETILDWIDTRLRDGAAAGVPARNLAPLAEVWDKLHASARDAEALNLDKRPLILSMFADLAEAARMAGRA